MKLTCLLITALICACMLFCSCGSDPSRVTPEDSLITNREVSYSDDESNYTYNSGVFAPTSYAAFKNNASDFSFDLLKNQYAISGGNTTITPGSTFMELALLANGSTKTTKQEITGTIAENMNLESLNQSIQYFQSRLKYFKDETDGEFYTSLGNALWCNDTFDIKNDFLKTDAKYYSVDAYRFLFSDVNAPVKIGNWIQDYSGVDNAPSPDVKESDCMYLTSGLNISDNWLEDYSAENITEGVFFGAEGETSVDFYSSSEYYISDDISEGFVKEFKNVPLKLCVILPQEGVNTKDFVQGLTGEDFLNLLENMDPTQRCTAVLPKFSQKGTVDLTEALKKTGVNRLFSDEAELSGITNSRQVYLNGVCAAFDFEISDKGISSQKINNKTESALPLDNTVQVRADRPFVFAVIDNESNVPLYLGIVETI